MEDKQFELLMMAITGLRTEMNDRFNGVENRLTGVENRLTGVENRLTSVESRLANLEGEVKTIRVQTANTHEKVSDLQIRVDQLEGPSV